MQPLAGALDIPVLLVGASAVETAPVVLSILADASARRLAQDMGTSPFAPRRDAHQIAVVEAFRRGLAVGTA